MPMAALDDDSFETDRAAAAILRNAPADISPPDY